MTAAFIRYLEAKKGIDDHSLNPRVWSSLERALAARRPAQPLRVLELGCGIGTMLERLLERGLFASVPARIEYTGVDASAALIEASRRRIPVWAGRLGFELAQKAGADQFARGGLSVLARWLTADAFDFAADPQHAGAFDLLLAHAFLDLVDVHRAIESFLPLLRPLGLFYFSLVFDGDTIFQPGLDAELDGQVERLYHQTMDQRLAGGLPSGSSRTGRLLFHLLPPAGGEILEAGSSDWVVFPSRRAYLPAERDFLDYILQTIEAALRDHPDLDPAALSRWLAQRRAQLGRGELSYIAHQLDFLGEYAGAA